MERLYKFMEIFEPYNQNLIIIAIMIQYVDIKTEN